MNMSRLRQKTASRQSYPDLPEEVRSSIIATEALEMLPREMVREFQAFVFEKNEEAPKIAALNPDDAGLRRYLTEKLPGTPELYMATADDVRRAMEQYARDYKEEITTAAERGVKDPERVAHLSESILDFALAERASDIHIESRRGQSLVRFRIDGILHTVAEMTDDIHAALIARIKVLANMRIDERRRPQDGRFEVANAPGTSLRVSTVPTLYGEKIAMRILTDASETLSLEDLGANTKQRDTLIRNIEKPFGMIIASGPTGSGKTTSLYALLDLLRKDQVNISTLEDPIEYAVQGVNQIQIDHHADLSFASGLRTLLRQDPEVLMVGEIRDAETAVMAAEAALTGHLVVTTLHTNDAPSVFTRLLEMGVEDFTIASTVNLAIAQRLVRRVCDSCREEAPLEEVIVKKLDERPDVSAALAAAGLSREDAAKKPLTRGVGCDACLGTGFQGRIALFEMLEMSRALHDAVLAHAPIEQIREIAARNGYTDIVSEGIEKALGGDTTISEVLRVTKYAGGAGE